VTIRHQLPKVKEWHANVGTDLHQACLPANIRVFFSALDSWYYR
jgi:hypothetical protein